MQNMKLLDLQTGKYLELGKEWGYFGEYITLIQIHTKTLIGTPYTRPLSPTHAPDYPTIQVEEIVNESKVCIYNHTNPIINQVAGKVGAVVYGGRYVLLNGFTVPKSNRYDKDHYFIGDVASVCVNCHSDADDYRLMILSQCDSTLLKWYEVHKFKKQGHYCIVSEIDTDYSDSFYNVFEEYSKQLRNEPNKFEDIFGTY